MNSGRRAQNGRRPVRSAPAGRPASKGPSPAVILMIIIPLIGIIGMGGYLLMNDKEPAAESKPDKSTRLEQLIAQVDTYKKKVDDVLTRMRDEEPGAQAKAERLMDDLGNWLDEWEAVVAEAGMRDQKGRWKEQYSGYSKYATTITKLRYDLSRSKNF